MTSFKFARMALPALTAAIIGFGTQAASAQTSAAPAPNQMMMMQGSMSQGSMAGMNMAAPAAPAAAATTTTTTTAAAPSPMTKPMKKHHMSGYVVPTSEKFSSLTAAQAHCPGDTVVWVNTGHGSVFHTASSKYFGKSKHGAYACEKAAMEAGLHPSKR
jgi:hypothetical protein